MDQFKKICTEVNSQQGSWPQTRADTANQEHSEMGNSAQVQKSGTQNEVNSRTDSVRRKVPLILSWCNVLVGVWILFMLMSADGPQPSIVLIAFLAGINTALAFVSLSEHRLKKVFNERIADALSARINIEVKASDQGEVLR